MNVYQETVKVLKELDVSTNVVYYCSQNAFELMSMYEAGKTIQEIAQYCIDNA